MSIELDINSVVRRLATKNADLTTQLTVAEVTNEQLVQENLRLEAEVERLLAEQEQEQAEVARLVD